VRLHTSRAAASAIVALYAARFVLAAGAFWFIAQQGALALLIALAGFLVARIVSQRLVGAG
jgi:type IV secretory pathway VirB3-like protein